MRIPTPWASGVRSSNPRRLRRRRSIAAVSVLFVLALSCSSEPPIDAGAPPPAPAEDRNVFVSLGGDETLTFGLDDGFRRAWTRQVFTSLPRSTVFVNAATEDATTRDGLDHQLADAVALDPTLVTVWFGAGDARVGTDPDRFAAELTELALALRNEGTKVILIGNEGNESMAAYLPIIESVAQETGTTYTAVPGPVGRPDDPAVQDAIAAAVLAGFGS